MPRVTSTHVPRALSHWCRFLADDRLVVSVGGNDRGIYQWRTCGVASGLPPLPVIYRRLDECMTKVRGGAVHGGSGARWGHVPHDYTHLHPLCTPHAPTLPCLPRAASYRLHLHRPTATWRQSRQLPYPHCKHIHPLPKYPTFTPPLVVYPPPLTQANGDVEAAKDLREGVWDELHRRSRAFRSYERLKLLAMRAAVEDKRVNSAASARPQPKMSEHMTWGRLPGTNQFGPRPKAEVDAEGDGGGAGQGSPSVPPRVPTRGSVSGVAGSRPVTPGSAGRPGTAGAGSRPVTPGSVAGGMGTAGAGSRPVTPGSVAGGMGAGAGAGAGASRLGTPGGASVLAYVAASAGGGSRPGTPGAASAAGSARNTPRTPPPAGAAAASRAASVKGSVAGEGDGYGEYDDDAMSGEVGSYEPSGVPSPGARGTPPRPPSAGGRTPSVRGSVAGSVAGGSRMGTPRGGAGAGDGGASGAATPRGAGLGGDGGRSGKRYVTQSSVAEDEDIPDDYVDGGGGDEF